MRLYNANAAYSQLGIIRDQLVYNGVPRYRLSREILRTKIMPRETVAVIDTPNAKIAVDENGDVVAAEAKPNWGPLALAAAVAFMALG